MKENFIYKFDWPEINIPTDCKKCYRRYLSCTPLTYKTEACISEIIISIIFISKQFPKQN